MTLNNNLNYDIVFPFYKDYAYLNKALSYINDQILMPKNLIFIDDGNKDSNLKSQIVKILSKKIKLKFISLPNNIGNIAGVLKGVENVTNEFFFIMAADDIYYPELAIKSLKTLSKYPGAGFVCSNIVSNFKDRKIKKFINYSFLKKSYYSSEEAKKILKYKSLKFYHNTIFYRSDLFKKNNYFNKAIGPRCDFYNLIFFSTKYGFTYVNNFLAEFTIRKNQINKQYQDVYLINELSLINKDFKSLYNLVKELDMFFDISPFGLFSLKGSKLSEIITFNLLKKSILFYIWRKIRIYIPDIITQTVYKLIN